MLDAKTQIEDVLAKFEGLTRPLSDAQFNWRPQSGVWSVGECLDHLTITARRFRAAIEEAVAHSRSRNLRYVGPASPSPFGRLFLKLLEPPVRLVKGKARRDFLPQLNRPASVVLSEFQTAHEDILRQLPEYLKWDQNRTRVTSPLPLKFSLGLMLQVIPAHSRRHLWQASEIIKMPGFPAN